jgi:uncharacterized protein (TIGR03067 family)
VRALIGEVHMTGLLRAMPLLAALAGCATAGAEAGLEGTWRAVEAERNGAPAPDVVGHRLTFAGERFRIVGEDGAPIYEGAWSADPTATPPAIDFVNDAGQAAGVTWLGAYRLGEGELAIVDNAPDPTRPRPTAIAAPAGSGYVMVEFAPEE